MANGKMAGKFLEHSRGEHVRHVAHGFMCENLSAVAGGNACAFLPAMLQSIKRKVRQFRRLGVAVDSNDSALFAKFIKHKLSKGKRRMECRDVTVDQCNRTVFYSQLSFHCNPDPEAWNIQICGDSGHSLPLSGGNENTRRRLPK